MIMATRTVLVAAFCASLTACGGGSNSNTSPSPASPDSLSLSPAIPSVIDESSEATFNIIGYDGETRVLETSGPVSVTTSNNNLTITSEDISAKEGSFTFTLSHGNKKTTFSGKISNNSRDSKNSALDGSKEESLIIIDNEEPYKVILRYIEQEYLLGTVDESTLTENIENAHKKLISAGEKYRKSLTLLDVSRGDEDHVDAIVDEHKSAQNAYIDAINSVYEPYIQDAGLPELVIEKNDRVDFVLFENNPQFGENENGAWHFSEDYLILGYLLERFGRTCESTEQQGAM